MFLLKAVTSCKSYCHIYGIAMTVVTISAYHPGHTGCYFIINGIPAGILHLNHASSYIYVEHNGGYLNNESIPAVISSLMVCRPLFLHLYHASSYIYIAHNCGYLNNESMQTCIFVLPQGTVRYIYSLRSDTYTLFNRPVIFP